MAETGETKLWWIQRKRLRIRGWLVENQRPKQALFCIWRCLRMIYIYHWILNNYSPKWRWIVVDIYRAAKQLRGKYPPLSPTLRWIIVLVISWITQPKELFLVFFGCSEVNSTWLITSELANRRVRKVLFTCVVYTDLKKYINRNYNKFLILIGHQQPWLER